MANLFDDLVADRPASSSNLFDDLVPPRAPGLSPWQLAVAATPLFNPALRRLGQTIEAGGAAIGRTIARPLEPATPTPVVNPPGVYPRVQVGPQPSWLRQLPATIAEEIPTEAAKFITPRGIATQVLFGAGLRGLAETPIGQFPLERIPGLGFLKRFTTPEIFEPITKRPRPSRPEERIQEAQLVEPPKALPSPETVGNVNLFEDLIPATVEPPRALPAPPSYGTLHPTEGVVAEVPAQTPSIPSPSYRLQRTRQHAIRLVTTELQDQAHLMREQAGSLIRTIREEGGIDPMKGGGITEEIRLNIPKELLRRGGRAIDELAADLATRRMLREGTSNELLEALASVRGVKLPTFQQLRQEAVQIVDSEPGQRILQALQEKGATSQATKRLIQDITRQTQRELRQAGRTVGRIVKQTALTPSQLARIARTQRVEPGATVVGPKGGIQEAVLSPEDVAQIQARAGGIVPRGITEAQRQRLATGQPTRLPGGPNQPPPVIPTTKALVPSELRPQRDVPISFTRATAEVDMQRASQFVDGKALGPVNRAIVQPGIQADARSVAKAQRKLAEFRVLARGIKKDSEIDAKLVRSVEDRALPTDVLSLGEQQLVEAWKTFAKVAIEEEINPVLVKLGKKPIAPRQNYVPHLPSLSFLSDLFGALERIPDELLERLPILKSVMETPIGQRDPSLPQAIKDLPYIPKHPSAFFLKPRIGGPFRESLLAGIEAYVPLWARITEVAPVAQILKPMVAQMPPNFRAMADQWLGELLGKRPRADVLIDSKALRALTTVQRLSSSSLILGRITTILLQYSSLANTAAKHGWFYTMRGLGRALTPQGRAFAELFSRELQQRMAVGTLLEGDRTPVRIANAGLEFTDQQMVSAAFHAAFEHYTKMPASRFQQLAGTPQTFDAIVNLANISAEQSQASMRRALQSPVLRSQLLRATASQLQTFNVNLRQQQFLDPQILAMATSKKEAALYVARLDANLLLMNLAYRFFGLRPPTDIADMIPVFDPWTGGVPIGVIGKAVESKGRFVPAAALLATAAFKLAVDAKEDGKLNAESMRTLVKVLTMPIPAGSQIATTIDGAFQVFQGGRRNRRDPTRFDYRIDNPLDAVKAITLGPTFTQGYQQFRERKFQPEPLSGRQRLLRQRIGVMRRRLAPRQPIPR